MPLPSTSSPVIPLHWSHDRRLAFVVSLRVLFHKAVCGLRHCLLSGFQLQDGCGSEVVGGGQLTLHNVTTGLGEHRLVRMSLMVLPWVRVCV